MEGYNCFEHAAKKFHTTNLNKAVMEKSISNLIYYDETIYRLTRLLHQICYPDPFIQHATYDDSYIQLHEILKNNFSSNLNEKLLKKNYKPKANQISYLTKILPEQIGSFEEHVYLMLGEISKTLISHNQYQKLIALLHKLPLILRTEKTLIELSLNNIEQIDIAIGVPQEDLTQLPTMHNQVTHIISKLITEFQSFNQTRPTGFLNWLGYDVQGNEEDMIVNLFPRFHPDLSLAINTNYFIEIIANQLSLNMDLDAINLIKHCLLNLPGNQHIAAIGYMLRRGPGHYNVIIVNFDLNEIPLFLNKLGWQDDGKLLEVLTLLKDQQFDLSLSIGIQSGIIQKIGIEVALKKTNITGYYLLLQGMVQLGICTKEKALALSESEYLYWGSNFNFYFLQIGYFKIVLTKESISAKAYLYYLTSAALKRAKVTKMRI